MAASDDGSESRASPTISRRAPGTFTRNPAAAVEDAIWSAQRDTSTGYGIAVFDYEPCGTDGKTTITFRYYHAVGADKTPTGDYELFEKCEALYSRSRAGLVQTGYLENTAKILYVD